MSAVAQTLGSGDTLNYDFSSGASQFYGSDAAAIEVETDVWGMWGGDFSQDDDVTSADYTGWYNAAIAGDFVYETADFNCDGEVTTADYMFWYNNFKLGVYSEVP